MKFWLHFALRSCLRRRRRTIITLLGIAFGVATMVVLGAIMVGVNDTMIKNAVAIHTGNVVVQGESLPLSQALTRVNKLADGLRSAPQIQAVLPRLHFPVLLTSAANRNLPLNIIAVAPRREALQTPVAGRMVAGQYFARDQGLVLGGAAAEKLVLKVGDQVALITSSRQDSIKVSGIFSLGIEGYDRSIGFITLARAQSMSDLNVNYEVAIFCYPGSNLKKIAERVSNIILPSEKVRLWDEVLPDVAQLVKLNEFSMLIMVVLVVIILGFGVANALLISVMDRYRSFAVLKAIGVRPREIFTVIMAEAFFMCLLAAVIGTILGSVVTLTWSHFGLDLSHYTSANPLFSVNSIIYPRLSAAMVLVPQAAALGAGILAAVWPALIAGCRPVNQVMRGAN